MNAIIEIPPPSRDERARHAVLSTSRRWFLQNPNPHFASLELESLFIRCVELHPERTTGVLDDCYDWLCTVANREGQPPWVLLEGVTGAQGSNLRATVGEDQIKKKCVNILRSYREPQRLRDAKDKLQYLARAYNVVATAVNNANGLTREDGEPEDGIDYSFSSVLVVDNEDEGDDEEGAGGPNFGGADGGGEAFGGDDEDPPAAPPQGSNGWGKKIKVILGVLVLSAGFALSCHFDTSCIQNMFNAILMPLEEEEGGVTNGGGTDSSGFSYTKESVEVEEENNVSDIEVPLICMDMWECGDIPQSLFMFTRDVSIPATSIGSGSTTNKRDWIWIMPLLLHQRLELEGPNRKLQDTVATHEAKKTLQLARIETLEARAAQRLSRIETYEDDAAHQLERIETLEAEADRRANMLKVCAVCLAVAVCFCGALAFIIKKNGEDGDSDGEQPISDGASPGLVHANSTDSDTLAGVNASPEVRNPRHGWHRVFNTPTHEKYVQ